jgi:hypothetical protein
MKISNFLLYFFYFPSKFSFYALLVLVQVISTDIPQLDELFGATVIHQIALRLESKQYQYREHIVDEQDQMNNRYLFLHVENRCIAKVRKIWDALGENRAAKGNLKGSCDGVCY